MAATAVGAGPTTALSDSALAEDITGATTEVVTTAADQALASVSVQAVIKACQGGFRLGGNEYIIAFLRASVSPPLGHLCYPSERAGAALHRRFPSS